jgi:transposase-like protein
MTRAETAKLWADRMRRFQQAEMSVAQFCNAEGVSQPSFYSWRRKLQSPANNAPSSVAKFVPVALQAPPGQPTTSDSRVRTTIELPGGIRICVEVPGELSSERTSRDWP